jgi:F-type H+-transporting ATPase subunit beta
MATEKIGRVVQIIGPVVDVEFDTGVPPIYNAVRIHDDGGQGGVAIDVITEVEQHLGRTARAASPCSPPTAWCAG